MSTGLPLPGAKATVSLMGAGWEASLAEAVLLAGFGSKVAALTVAVTVWVPSLTSPASPVMVRVAVAPGASDPIVQVPELVENSAIAVELVFHADCWYSLISPASLGRSWIRSAGTGKGSTAGSSPGARRPMPWPWWLRPAL
jgi:hypothetical protein